MSSKQKLVGRVVFVSGMNGWFIAGVGVLGGLFSLLTGVWFGFFLCLLITVSGWMELKGRSKIKQGLPEAGGWLTASQIWLLLIIVFYAGFQLASFDASDPLAKFSPEMKNLLDTQLGLDSQAIGLLVAKLYYTTYISLIVAAFLYQGGLWLYYWRSSKKILRLSLESRNEVTPGIGNRSPATLKLMKNLSNIKKLLLITDHEVNNLGFEANDRNRISGAIFDIVHEHAKSTVLLLENRHHSSAFALARPLFEGFVRGAWLRHCANDDEVESVIAKDEFKLNFGEMLKAVEDRRKWPDTLTQVKKNVWSGLHSYTHGGMLQISRRVGEDTIESNVDEKEIDEFIRLVSLISYLSLFEIVEMSKTNEKDQVLKDLGEWVSGWCFNNQINRDAEK